MEKKLKEYRKRKRIHEFINSSSEKLKKFILPSTKMENNEIQEHKINLDTTTTTTEVLSSDESIIESPVESKTVTKRTILDYFLWFLYFLCWATFYLIFIKYGFGTVYIILSTLVGLYLNTRTEPKQDGEKSAYSVFNENCERIDGTLSAEQFEKEMGYRM